MNTAPRVVIIGAGIVGCSLADELILRGWSDVTVVDQGRLFRTGGSTSHAPGIIFQTNASKTMTEFAMTTIAKAATLTLDGRWCLNPVGSLELALTEDRLRELHRRQGYAEAWGLDARVIDPDETARLWPLVDRDVVLGAYHVPSDGLTDAVRVSEAQARRATEGGARFLGDHTVTGIRTDDGRVRGVITERGEIPADIVVCAAGIWGQRIGAMVGMTVALQPLAHQLSWTTPLPEVEAFGIPRRPGGDPPEHPRPGPGHVSARVPRPPGGRRVRPCPAAGRRRGPAPSARRAGHAVGARVHARHLRRDVDVG